MRGLWEPVEPTRGDQMARTFAACSPLGPWLVSNSTFCPSSRLRYPVPEIALKCTKTSGPPPSWVMKPKPFSPLNHFTEPVAIENPLLPWPDLTRFLGGHGRCDSLESEGFPICNGGALG